MNKINLKNTAVTLIIVFISLILVFIGNNISSKEKISEETQSKIYNAKVLSVGSMSELPSMSEGVSPDKEVPFKAQITNGNLKGKVVDATQNLAGMIAIQDKTIEKNDLVLITKSAQVDGENLPWVFASYNRVLPLIVLAGIFLLFILLIGRWKGLSTILSLGITILLIFMLYIPLILRGTNVYILTILIGGYI
ncbi:MAG: YibE/F family protein, partial [Anaerovoracaceae bacterium]